LITPLLLGAAFGTVTEGAIRVSDSETVTLAYPLAWLSPYCIANGVLALCTCAYLAAVYLTNETTGELRKDFRHRAILAGTATAFMAGVVVVLAYFQANWFFERLLGGYSLPVVLVGLGCFAGSAWAVIGERYLLSRIFAAFEIALLILGWGLAQHPYLAYPDLKFETVAAPHATLKFLVLSLPFGAALVLPSLWLLLNVFKSQDAEPIESAK
jgi:cytochrome d ubiquinol oxidase subunit II